MARRRVPGLIPGPSSGIGQSADAQATWDILDPMGRNWPRAAYRPGAAEGAHAQFRFWQGDLSEEIGRASCREKV